MSMAETNRNYVLLNCFAAAEKAEYEGFRNRRETLGQYFLRTTAGVPLISEHEIAYEKEVSAQRERRLKLFWDSFPLIMRNWKKILKAPAFSNISMDPIGVVHGIRGVTLGSLAFAWRAHCMRTTCPECNEDAYFIPYVEHPFTMFCSLPDDFPDFPEKSHIYCSACGKENDLYEYEHDPQSKCCDFRLLLEKWMCCHRPTESGIVFETAVHLLKLGEIYGEEVTPSWR